MFYTDDPIEDFHRYDAEQEARLAELPVCSECGEHIQTEHCYEFGDGLICEDCLDNNHRKFTDDCA